MCWWVWAHCLAASPKGVWARAHVLISGHCPSGLSGKQQDSLFGPGPWSSREAWDHHPTTTMFDDSCHVLLSHVELFYNQHSIDYVFLKCFLINIGAFRSFCSAVVSDLNFPRDVVSAQSLSYCWVMTSDRIWREVKQICKDQSIPFPQLCPSCPLLR